MYFLYIYKTMKGFKRVIIAPFRHIEFIPQRNAIAYLRGIEKTIGFVDDYITIKNVHEQVVIKNKTIIKFQGKSIEDFQAHHLESVSDINGTSFLICNN